VKTGGKNFKEFQEVAMGKSNKDSEKTLIEKITRNYTENSLGHFLILSGQNSELPKLEQNPKFDIKCDQECRDNLPIGAVAIVLFSLGVIAMLKNLVFEKDPQRRDFLILVFIWFITAFGLFTPLAFDISPRFWLLVSVMPFIFLGFTFELLRKITPPKFSLVLIAAIILGLTGSNLYQTYKRFDGLQNASNKAMKISADRILKERHFVTLEQQYQIIDYVESFYKENGYPVYLNSDPFYRRSLLFHLDMRNVPRDDFRNVTSSKKVYQNGNYFLVYPTNSNLEKELNEYSLAYSETGRKQVGTLTVIQLTPKASFVTDIQQIIEPRGKSKSAPGVPERYTWEEIFNEEEEEEE
jgi:Ca2+/Na+ antiporter